MLFLEFNFANIRMIFATEKIFGTETSDLQVKFCSKVAFNSWCFSHFHYFILRLIRVTYRKFW